MVGVGYAPPAEGHRFHFTSIKYVVDMEVEPVHMISYHRAECALGESAPEVFTGYYAHGVAVGNIVEIAAYDYVFIAERVNLLAQHAGLTRADAEGVAELTEQLMSHCPEIVGAFPLGEFLV